VKNILENQEVIKKFQITNENVADRLTYLIDSGDQLAAADVFNLIGRIDLSMPAYLKVVSLWPERGKVWMVLGRTELTKTDQANSNPALAAIFLERAINEGWKTWESYSYLALAYFRTGQLERAKTAVKEELKIDPENPDGQKWLGVLADEKERLRNEKSKQ
jgi:tetratricopeptide (TPR) repeat protein